MATNKNFKDTVLNILEKPHFTHTLQVRLDDCLIEIQTNSARLKDKLSHYFQPFVQPKNQECNITVKAYESQCIDPELDFIVKKPEPGKTKIKEEYCDLDTGRVVKKRLTGMLYYFNNEHCLAMGPCTENENQVINFVNNRFIQWKLDQNCLLCHAAAVSNNGNGLALAGFSGMGKSTLALHLMNNELIFISNDRLMIEKNGADLKMYGVAKLPRVNPGTILNNPSLTGILSSEDKSEFLKIDPRKIWNLEQKYDVFLDQCFGPDKFRLTSSVKALVLLNWHHVSEPFRFTEINLRERQDLLSAVMKSPGLFYLSSDHADCSEPDREKYLDLFSNCQVYELSGGVDFSKAAEECCQIIK